MKRFWRAVRRLLLVGFALLAFLIVLATKPDSPRPLPTTLPYVSQRPSAMRMPVRGMSSFPKHTDPTNPFEVDLRWRDVSSLNLVASIGDLTWASFDSSTIWPQSARLPGAYDPARVMELGKDPGLGIRSLHARGITGRGIGIAIIDQPLLIDHQEYASQLRLYEEVGLSIVTRGLSTHTVANLHGCATASVAVGRSCGVAPEADLYYIATTAASHMSANLR